MTCQCENVKIYRPQGMCTIPTFCVEKFVNISETQKTKFLHDMQKNII